MIDYATLTHNSPFAIKRLSHRARFEHYCDFLKRNENISTSPKLLDFGSGDGYLFNVLKQKQINSYTLFAYEPVPSQMDQLKLNVENNNLNVACLSSLNEKDKFDIIICAEVLEHFSAANAIKNINIIKSCLSISGKALVSVPIEIGLAGASKNIIRALIGQSHSSANTLSILRSLLDHPIYRGGDNYISSHIGFSYKKLQYLLIDAGFVIERSIFSPFPVLRSVANSQVIFECKPR